MTQCAGTTQKGERCKREAREASAYCAIHLDQESRPRTERPAAGVSSNWTPDDTFKAAIGFGILAAIVIFRIRR
jgi:hypothetical protein